MAGNKVVCPWKFLATLPSSPFMVSAHSSQDSSHDPSSPSLSPQRKTFAQALSNACDVPYSQLPKPCIKGDEISIKIPEEEYMGGLLSWPSDLGKRRFTHKD